MHQGVVDENVSDVTNDPRPDDEVGKFRVSDEYEATPHMSERAMPSIGQSLEDVSERFMPGGGAAVGLSARQREDVVDGLLQTERVRDGGLRPLFRHGGSRLLRGLES